MSLASVYIDDQAEESSDDEYMGSDDEDDDDDEGEDDLDGFVVNEEVRSAFSLRFVSPSRTFDLVCSAGLCCCRRWLAKSKPRALRLPRS